MPKYKIQLKQGKRTLVAHGEFSSVSSCLAHYQAISTMQVCEILRIEYEDHTTPPPDDYAYRSLFKGYIKNKDSRKIKQVIFHNIKPHLGSDSIASACKANMRIDGLVVDEVISSLIKT